MVGVLEILGIKNDNVKRPQMRGHNSSGNSSKTMYLHAPEYREPVSIASRKSSVTSVATSDSGANGDANLIDLSKISSEDFEKLYKNMKKGEPSNRVNF